MSNEKLAEQLAKLKEACFKWEKELAIYSKWAIDNDGVLSAAEKTEIDRRKTEIAAIKARIAQIEKAKGIEPKNFLEKIIDGAKEFLENAADKIIDFFDGDDENAVAPVLTPIPSPLPNPVPVPTPVPNVETKVEKTEDPKNKLGITKEQVKEKLGAFFAAFDKFTVVVEGATVEVETPYFMNDGNAGGKWDGNNVNAGKGSPKEVQDWLQGQIDKGKITDKDPLKLRQYLKDNKIGVDCSGFVSQALNHVADKDGDMEYESDDAFKPDNTGSGTFTGSKFTKVEPANVQIGDTLYFKNAPGKVNHIRIVGDVRTENGVVYYTIYESAGSTGPRKMEWKFEGGKLQEFSGGKWVVKSSDTFYRWKELEMEVPTGGGAGQGQQQDQQSGNTDSSGDQASKTLTASVGQGGSNQKADVLLIQELLNKNGATLKVDGDCGAKSIAAIKAFQQSKLGAANSSGLIEPGSQSWKALNGETAVSPPVENPVPSKTLTASVGQGGSNQKADVMLIQELLNKNGATLKVDGDCGAKSIAAIKAFQQSKLGAANSSGLIEPGSQSWKALNGEISTNPDTNTETPTDTTQNTNPQSTEVEEALSPNSAIKQSVGDGGKNESADVLRVKQLLNKFGYKLAEDGNADAALTTAIKDFQTKYRGSANPDGKIDPGGGTWNSLLGIGRIQGQLLAMSQQYGIEPAVILAIQQIESGGNGYLPDGRPKILFEGHVFWSQLQKAGKNPQNFLSGNEDILYPSWDRTKYQGGAQEYDRLEKAKKIDEICALKSASWGEFQIMGFNHATVGYGDVKSFVDAMHIPNGSSLKAVMEFCKSKNILKHVQGANKDWAKFAYSYNGSGYAQNQYDVKLAAAYERYKKITG